jgi:hypothetical protein
MIRVKGSAGNALARSLNESFRNIIGEDTNHCIDTRGNKWSRTTAVRNETHPHFQKAGKGEKQHHLDGIAHEEQSRNVWVNQKTGQTHENEMILHPNGKASPFSHSGNPELFHFSHYFETEE